MSDMKCLGCKYFETELCYRCDSCYDQFEPIETPRLTNADRIRSMTDEELADWVWGIETAGRAYGPRGEKAWLDWLKQEVDT